MNKHKDKQETSENRHQGMRRGFIFAGRRLWVILILAATAAAVVVFSPALKRIKSSASSDNKPSTFTVRRDDLPITVTESGSIRARNIIEIKCQVEAGRSGLGVVTITSIIPEGTYITQEDVNNGKVLVRLDSAAFEEELTQREIDFASAEASYTQAKEANDIQVKQNESDITAAKLKVKFALMDFKKYLGETVAEKLLKDTNPTSNPNIDIPFLLEQPQLGGDALKSLKKLNNDIIMSDGKFKQASNQLNWTQKLREKGYVSQTELERDELDAQSNEIQKEQAEIELELFKLYTFPKDVEKLLSDYEEAKRELDRTYARCRSKLAQAQANLKSAESRFLSRRDRQDKTKRNIKLCTIRAPAPGLVVYGSGTSRDRWRGMRGSGIIAEGETVYQRQTIISLPDTAEMMAEIFVHESSVDKVRPGQRAKLVLEALPDTTFEGEVLKVAPLPNQERGWFNPDLKVYATQVSIEGSHKSLKTGKSAKVTILVEELEDVIIAPVQTVANQEGKKVCYCLTTDGIERREVQTGSFNDTFVQIIDGLEAGEEVLLSPPRLTEAKVEAKPKTKEQEESKGRERPKEREEPRQDRQIELTDEAIERIMGFLAQRNPEKAKELEQLRESDPERFKAELRKLMREQFRRSRRGRDDTNRGGGDARVPEKR